MNEEELIELIKKYPVLYDMSSSQHRDNTIRANAWEEISEKMHTNIEEVKDKWKKLRNCFTNALKRHRKKSGQAANKVVPWKYEKQMEFLLPHLDTRSSVTNLSKNDDPTQESELIFSEEYAQSPPSTIRSPTPRTSSSRASTTREYTANNSRNKNNNNDTDLLKEMVNVMKNTHDIRQKRAVPEMDENDHFFLSMSKQLKKLPSTDQAEIKFQIHKLIHDSEMKMLNNQQQILGTPIKIISDKYVNKTLVTKPIKNTFSHTITQNDENEIMSIQYENTLDSENFIHNQKPYQTITNYTKPRKNTHTHTITQNDENEIMSIQYENTLDSENFIHNQKPYQTITNYTKPRKNTHTHTITQNDENEIMSIQYENTLDSENFIHNQKPYQTITNYTKPRKNTHTHTITQEKENEKPSIPQKRTCNSENSIYDLNLNKTITKTIKPVKSTHTRANAIIQEEENEKMNIPYKTTRDSEHALFDMDTNQTITNSILTQYKNDYSHNSPKVSEVETESPNENLKEFYDNFSY